MRKPPTVVLAVAALLPLAAIGSELAVPSIAESKVRDRLAPFGQVTEVTVSSTPAIKLLFGDVDEATVHMSTATVDAAGLDADALHAAAAVDVVHAEVDDLRAGPVDLSGIVVDKEGDQVDAAAQLDAGQLNQLVPGAQVAVEAGRLVLEIADLPLPIPVPGPIRLELAAESGAVVVRALGPLAGLFPSQTLLQRPDLSVDDLQFRLSDGVVSVDAAATLHADA